MNIMQKLTVRQMLLNKRRTIVTILGIMFSVALFTSVSIILPSFMEMFQRAEIQQSGNWHTIYNHVTASDLPVITEDESTAETAVFLREGVSRLEIPVEGRQFVSFQRVNESGFSVMSFHLREGRLPQNNREVVISPSLAQEYPEIYAVGKTVTLELGERYPTEEGLGNLGYSVSEMTQEEIQDALSTPVPDYNSSLGEGNETFVPTGTQTVTVVGIADFPSQFETDYGPTFAIFSLLDPTALTGGEELTVYVQHKELNNGIYEDFARLQETLANRASPEVEGGVHTMLLGYSLINQDTTFIQTMLWMVGIVILIIMAGSIALIYNSFAISISERSTLFGMLSGFGATRRQKRFSVLFEAGVLALIGIPLGLGLGFAGMAVTFAIINPMLNNMLAQPGEVSLYVVVWPAWIAVAVGVSLLTIFLSAWIPARRASRMSPIDAIRKSQDIKLSARKVKTSKVTRKLFGFEGELALKNFRRNKKRYRVTIVSLVMSFILFIGASMFTETLGVTTDRAMDEVEFDVTASATYLGHEGQTFAEKVDQLELLLDRMLQEEHVTDLRVGLFHFTSVLRLPEAMLSDDVKQYYADMGWDLESEPMGVQVVAVPDEALASIARDAGVDVSLLTDPENPRALFVKTGTLEYSRPVNGAGGDGGYTHMYKDISYLDAQPGESMELLGPQDPASWENAEGGTISVSVENGQRVITVNQVDGEEIPLETKGSLEIAGYTNGIPAGFSNHVYTARSIQAVVSMDVYESLAPQFQSSPRLDVGVTSSDHQATAQAFGSLYSEMQKQGVSEYGADVLEFSTNDIAQYREQIQQTLLIFNIFCYGFIALISLVGIANIFNTLSTSIALRRKEFAMLRSVGMSPKSFAKMIRFESLFYGFKAVLYGVPLAFLVMLLFWGVLMQNVQVAFFVPWVHLICGVVAIFLIVAISMLYSSSKIKKENILEALRNDNI